MLSFSLFELELTWVDILFVYTSFETCFNLYSIS